MYTFYGATVKACIRRLKIWARLFKKVKKLKFLLSVVENITLLSFLHIVINCFDLKILVFKRESNFRLLSILKSF